MSATHREIPLYTLSGVKDAAVTIHPVETADKLGLTLTRFLRGPSESPVLILHGLTTSSDMFIMPEHYNLVQYLLDHGFTDVWCLDYRMSNRFVYNLRPHRYTLDDIALYDHPAAVREIRRHAGTRRLHVISHCLGSLSFLMSLFGEAVSDITSVVANSVGLIPRVSPWMRAKVRLAPLFERVLSQPFISPRWADDPIPTVGKLVSRLVSLGHHECDEPACHMLSFMWGEGAPALYEHENLDPITHRRGRDLYGGTGVHYSRHMARMIKAGRAVKYDPRDSRYQSLPDDYLANAGRIRTPVLLLAGEKNRIFWDSAAACFEALESVAPGRHRLELIPGYGHQDIFMGKRIAKDVCPTITRFLHQA